jgi:hypothetical protein
MTERTKLRAVLSARTAAAGVLDRASDARSARRRRRRLAQEIATYRTPAERLELDLILGRHSAEDVQEIEEILRQQDAHRAFAERTQAAPGVRI